MTQSRDVAGAPSRQFRHPHEIADEELLALPAHELIARIRALEMRLTVYDQPNSLARALLTVPGRPAIHPQARIGRPPIIDLEDRQVAWAIAAAEGGTIDQWLHRNGVPLRPIGRVQNSAYGRVRTMVFVLAEANGITAPSARLEQIARKFANQAKAGRVLLRKRAAHAVR